MAATATVSAGIRYAPEDPTLPKPWRGLVDGKTGYLYFWNPETNVTQYERPVSSLHEGSTPLHKSLSSSVPVQKCSQGQRHESNAKDDDDRYNRGGNVASAKISSGVGSYQASRSEPDHPRDVSNMAVGASGVKGYPSSSAGIGLSGEAYRRRHEISVMGDNVPPPLTLFDSTGFPSEILREVRYFAPGRS